MADIKQGRWTAEIEGDFVVFLIGARHQLEVARAPVAQRPRRPPGHEAHAEVPHRAPGEGPARLPDVGLRRSSSTGARSSTSRRSPRTPTTRTSTSWRNYWKRVGKTGRTGIWHETFLVRAGEYEAIYGNMPPRGLGKAGHLVPVAESVGARQRLKAATRGT